MYKFEKYHGAGNDFVFLDYEEDINYSQVALTLCERKLNIGADGLIVVKKNPLEMIYYNQDGSRAPMCGNGIRCFAHYCYNNNIISSDIFDVNTLAGIMKIEISNKEPFMVKVNMSKPVFSKESIQLTTEYTIPLMIENTEVYSLFMGTIHSVVFVDNLESISDGKLGALIESHEYFKAKTNVNFVEVVDEENLNIRTYERGVGFTAACGTGCCASAIIANKYRNTSKKVSCHLDHGNLLIDIKDDVYMSGPSVKVCKGETNYV